MKRFALLTLILLLFFTLALPVYADVPGELPPDSFTIDDAIREKFWLQPSETLFRVYEIPIREAFSNNDNITDVLASQESLKTCYATCDNDGTVKVYSADGTPHKTNGEVQGHAADMLRSGQAIAKVADDIVVYHTYFLSAGETDLGHEGTAIYYVTDRGDYVYYTSYFYDAHDCLFPVDAFCSFKRAVTKRISLAPPQQTIGPRKTNIWDLSVYEINSSNFNIHALYPRPTTFFCIQLIKAYFFPCGVILIAVVVAAGTALCFFIRRKKQRRKKSNP